MRIGSALAASAVVVVVLAFVALSGANWRGFIAGLLETRATRIAREQENAARYADWKASVDAENAKEAAADEAEWQAYIASVEGR